MRIITIGGATYDIFLEYRTAQTTVIDNQTFLLLQEGIKVDVDAITYYSGGGATNCAASFARLGFDATAFIKIGNDLQGQFILNDLAKEKIHEQHVISSSNTSCSIIIPTPSGDRTVLVYRGAGNTLTPQEVPLDSLKSYDCVYVSSLSGSAAPALPLIAERAHKNKVKVVVNPGSSQLKSNPESVSAALPNIDILILNEYEAGLCWTALLKTNPALQKKYGSIPFDLKTYFKELLALGVSIAVVTNGAQGVTLATANEILSHPSIPVKVVSSVGAGDAFASCFAAQLLQGKKIEDALRAGIVNSASVISHVGAKTGLLNQAALDKKIEGLDKSLLKRSKIGD